MSKGKKEGDRTELLTIDEMDRLLNVVAGDLYFTTLYRVLRYSGRRIGEIYGTSRDKTLTGGVRLKDINFETDTMKTVILKTKKRNLQIKCLSCKQEASYKNKYCPNCGKEMPAFNKEELFYSQGKEIEMPMRKEVKSILQTFIKANNFKQNDYIFRKYSLAYLKKIIKTHIKQAGITKNFSLHGFRHYFVTQCKREGLSNEDIALWTGHVRLDTLNTYNRLVPKDIEKKIMEVKL